MSRGPTSRACGGGLARAFSSHRLSGNRWVPDASRGALRFRHGRVTPRASGAPTPVHLCSEPRPRIGSQAAHGQLL